MGSIGDKGTSQNHLLRPTPLWKFGAGSSRSNCHRWMITIHQRLDIKPDVSTYFPVLPLWNAHVPATFTHSAFFLLQLLIISSIYQICWVRVLMKKVNCFIYSPPKSWRLECGRWCEKERQISRLVQEYCQMGKNGNDAKMLYDQTIHFLLWEEIIWPKVK